LRKYNSKKIYKSPCAYRGFILRYPYLGGRMLILAKLIVRTAFEAAGICLLPVIFNFM